jgi:glutamate N-acetyltransferase/amino-acid N-acetyltransferase
MSAPPDCRVPIGFLFAATKAGIKRSGNPDLALIEAPRGASAAALFTRNLVVAAPITVGRKYLRSSRGQLRAILVNAGNANCATGKQGIKAAEASCKALSKEFGCKPAQVLPSSTGVIGVPFPLQKLLDGLPSLVEQRGRSADHAFAFARAIMTTDTRPKLAQAEFTTRGKTVRLLGIAKGAGMIHPNMATMLAYIVTDIAATPKQLQSLLRHAADRTFNRISIDGDTSTNDTLCALASGGSDVSLDNSGVRTTFAGALKQVCQSLSEQIISDGEGVKHVVCLKIEGAKSEAEAEQIARTVAHSPLVKTAWAGADPNWGRILAAIGRSGINLDPSKIKVQFGPVPVCRNGQSVAFNERKAHEYLSRPKVDITVNLGRGKNSIEFLTTDLTAEYVHINADYTT